MLDKVTMVARLFLGAIFFIFGLNGFLQFMPLPELPEKAAAYMSGLQAAGFFFPVLKLTEIVAGLMLLIGRFVPLGLVLLAPIVVQIFLFHLFLTPGLGNLGLPLALLVVQCYLGFVAYRDRFAGVLAP